MLLRRKVVRVRHRSDQHRRGEQSRRGGRNLSAYKGTRKGRKTLLRSSPSTSIAIVWGVKRVRVTVSTVSWHSITAAVTLTQRQRAAATMWLHTTGPLVSAARHHKKSAEATNQVRRAITTSENPKTLSPAATTPSRVGLGNATRLEHNFTICMYPVSPPPTNPDRLDKSAKGYSKISNHMNQPEKC